MREDLAVKLQAVDVGDADAVMVALSERLQYARGKLALYNRLRDHLLAGRSEAEFMRDAERIGPYLTLMGGRMLETQIIRWCESVIAALSRRSQRQSKPTVPRERR